MDVDIEFTSRLYRRSRNPAMEIEATDQDFLLILEKFPRKNGEGLASIVSGQREANANANELSRCVGVRQGVNSI